MNKFFLLIILILDVQAKDILVGILLGSKKDGLRKTSYSQKFYDAVEMGFEQAKHDLKKKNILVKFKVYEIEEDPLASYYSAMKAKKDGVDFLIGPSVSFYIPGVVKALEGTGIVAITPYASTIKIKDNPNIYNISKLDDILTKYLEEFVNKKFKGKKRVLVCAKDVEVSYSACHSFSENFINESISISTDSNLTNIEELVKKIVNLKPDIVISPNRIPITGFLIKKLLAKNFKPVFIGNSSLGEVYATGLVELVGRKDFEAFMVREFSSHNLKQKMKFPAVFEKLNEDYGNPRLTSLLFYDAAAYSMEVLLKSGSVTMDSLRKNYNFESTLFSQRNKKDIYNVVYLKDGVYRHYKEVSYENK